MKKTFQFYLIAWLSIQVFGLHQAVAGLPEEILSEEVSESKLVDAYRECKSRGDSVCILQESVFEKEKERVKQWRETEIRRYETMLAQFVNQESEGEIQNLNELIWTNQGSPGLSRFFTAWLEHSKNEINNYVQFELQNQIGKVSNGYLRLVSELQMANWYLALSCNMSRIGECSQAKLNVRNKIREILLSNKDTVSKLDLTPEQQSRIVRAIQEAFAEFELKLGIVPKDSSIDPRVLVVMNDPAQSNIRPSSPSHLIVGRDLEVLRWILGGKKDRLLNLNATKNFKETKYDSATHELKLKTDKIRVKGKGFPLFYSLGYGLRQTNYPSYSYRAIPKDDNGKTIPTAVYLNEFFNKNRPH